MDMKKIGRILVLLFMICLSGMDSIPSAAAGIAADRIEVVIPSLKRDYTFVVAADQHIVAADTSDLTAAGKKAAGIRRNMFRSSAGVSSAESWKALVKEINGISPDGVVLAGDMVDFYSENNFALLRWGIRRIKAPVMYLRADHDQDSKYLLTHKRSKMKSREKALDGNAAIMSREYPGFILVGINNNYRQITKGQLTKLKKLWKKKKPIILFLHVPLAPVSGDGLVKAAQKAWSGQSLLWGKGYFYEPNKRTKQFMSMVTQKNSPVKAVFAGHLHFGYKSMLNKKIPQYVLDASYKGRMTIITVRGKSSKRK